MHLAFSLWGMEVSAERAIGLIALYILVSVIAIVWIPRRAVPDPAEPLDLDTRTKLIDLRSKVRQSVIQVVAGVTAVAAFLVTLQQIRQSEDTFKKAKADLFVESVSGLLEGEAKLGARVKAMYLLSFVASSDPSYHRTVFHTLANQIVSRSPAACKGILTAKPPPFLRDQHIHLAIRLLGERNPDHDPTGKRFDIEGACLVETDLHDEPGVVRGLRRVRLSNAIMLRSDYSNVDLSEAELRYIMADDYRNAGWKSNIGLLLHRGVEGGRRGEVDYADYNQRKQFVTSFSGANLSGADFQGAELTGADFSHANLSSTKFLHANVSRANFIKARNLDPKRLKNEACAGNRGMTKEQLLEQQPYFSADVRRAIGDGGLNPCN